MNGGSPLHAMKSERRRESGLTVSHASVLRFSPADVADTEYFDWLLRYYDFTVDELLSEERPDFNIYLDPKCDWALRHLECFPIEINRADYRTLLRVPGIGAKSAQRIVKARRTAALGFSDLKKIGVVLKRALYFITCSGKMMYRTKLDEDYICRNLIGDRTQIPREIREAGYKQLSLFDIGMEP